MKLIYLILNDDGRAVATIHKDGEVFRIRTMDGGAWVPQGVDPAWGWLTATAAFLAFESDDPVGLVDAGAIAFGGGDLDDGECPECDGYGQVMVCPDDMCRAAGGCDDPLRQRECEHDGGVDTYEAPSATVLTCSDCGAVLDRKEYGPQCDHGPGGTLVDVTSMGDEQKRFRCTVCGESHAERREPCEHTTHDVADRGTHIERTCVDCGVDVSTEWDGPVTAAHGDGTVDR